MSSRSQSIPSKHRQGSHASGLDHQGSGHCLQESFVKGHFWCQRRKTQGSGSQTFKNEKCSRTSSRLSRLVIQIQEVISWGGTDIPGNLYFVKDVGVGGRHF